MTTRKRVAHTASFLQTFHTGQTTAARRAATHEPECDGYGDCACGGAQGSEPKAAPADEAAVAFVKGQKAATFAQPTTAGQYFAEYRGIRVRHGQDLITEPQAKYVVAIALDREGVTDAMLKSLAERLEQGFAKHAASQFITTYKGLPYRSKAPSAAMMEAVAPGASGDEFRAAQSVVKTRPEVADGRYAVEHEGVLKFFKLKNGRKAGFVFLDVQASDDWHPIRNPKRIDEILALIAADELTAARRYGQELGKCSRCGRTLTDETSRAYGIGPDCRSK